MTVGVTILLKKVELHSIMTNFVNRTKISKFKSLTEIFQAMVIPVLLNPSTLMIKYLQEAKALR